MSIYVSIATLYDPELPFTLDEIYSKSDNPQDIYVGVALTIVDRTPKEIQNSFIKDISRISSKNPNIHFSIFEGEENQGIGKGRNNAASMYNGQDYFLQIDAHTMFDFGWDTQLTDLYLKAVKETDNINVILTSYLGSYWHTKSDGRIQSNQDTWFSTQVIGSLFQAPKYYTNFQSFDTEIPKYRSEPYTSLNFEQYSDSLFSPATKFNAQFAFGNKEFAKDRSLPEHIIFWEEEPIQSIELFDRGFALVFPKTKLKLMHLYTTNYDLEDAYRGEFDYFGREIPMDPFFKSLYIMKENFLNYINDEKNKNKIKKWEEYSGFSVRPSKTIRSAIPKSYK